MYNARTRNIEVEVEPSYLEDRSDASAGQHVWAYRVTIANRGRTAVQLLTRYWRITDATGHVQEVRGPGVVGEQPVIDPGVSYTYVSGCPLKAPSGVMQGSYRMVDEFGEAFDVAIPAFSLDIPGNRAALH